jgi:hypothetical protein
MREIIYAIGALFSRVLVWLGFLGAAGLAVIAVYGPTGRK